MTALEVKLDNRDPEPSENRMFNTAIEFAKETARQAWDIIDEKIEK